MKSELIDKRKEIHSQYTLINNLLVLPIAILIAVHAILNIDDQQLQIHLGENDTKFKFCVRFIMHLISTAVLHEIMTRLPPFIYYLILKRFKIKLKGNDDRVEQQSQQQNQRESIVSVNNESSSSLNNNNINNKLNNTSRLSTTSTNSNITTTNNSNSNNSSLKTNNGNSSSNINGFINGNGNNSNYIKSNENKYSPQSMESKRIFKRYKRVIYAFIESTRCIFLYDSMKWGYDMMGYKSRNWLFGLLFFGHNIFRISWMNMKYPMERIAIFIIFAGAIISAMLTTTTYVPSSEILIATIAICIVVVLATNAVFFLHKLFLYEQLYEKKKALERSEKSYKNLYEQAPTMFLSVNSETMKICNCNRATESHTQYTKQELMNFNNLFDLFESHCIATVKRILESHRSNNEQRKSLSSSNNNNRLSDCYSILSTNGDEGNRKMSYSDISICKKNGEPMYVTMNVSSIDNFLTESDTKTNIYHLILHDVTDRRILHEQLKQEAKRAERANIAKSQFLSVISHELITPLNGITGSLSLLNVEHLDDEQKRLIDTVKNCSDVLFALISDILDFSKIEEGKLILNEKPFDLHSSIYRLHQYILKPLAEQKGLSCEVNIDVQVPKYIIGDEKRLTQILMNLFINGVKFTERGKVDVFVSVYSEAPPFTSECTLRFDIIDTGCGISAEGLQRLFQAYSQLDGSISRRYGGIGIGLSISKSICNLMGGSITCTSVEREGSTFSFTAKITVTTQEMVEFEQKKLDISSTATPTIKPLQILVVDDNNINRQVLAKMLKTLHCQCDTAEDGLKAIEKCKKIDYDVIFMDLSMPNMDGLQCTIHLRDMEKQINKKRKSFIIALTANAGIPPEECLNIGMNYYLSKPVKISDVKHVLEEDYPNFLITNTNIK
ncbi:hypothetical protein ABK040_010947 [Willaertia magna]